MGKQHFGVRLKRLMEKNSISLQRLSDGLFDLYGSTVSPQAIHAWTKGGGIDIDNLLLLCRYFNVSVPWLYNGEDEIDTLDLSVQETIKRGTNSHHPMYRILRRVDNPADIALERMGIGRWELDLRDCTYYFCPVFLDYFNWSKQGWEIGAYEENLDSLYSVDQQAIRDAAYALLLRPEPTIQYWFMGGHRPGIPTATARAVNFIQDGQVKQVFGIMIPDFLPMIADML